MILSVDTNLLLRAFLMDEPGISERAARAIETLRQSGRLYLPSCVLLEFVWVLTPRKLPRRRIAILAESELAGAQKLRTFDENLCKERANCIHPPVNI